MDFKLFISKKRVCLFIFIFVNFLFLVKYSSRILFYYLPFSIFISVLFILLWNNRFYLIGTLIRFKISYKALLILFLILSFFIFLFIPKETLHVDRWSVINSFWENYFNNKYVYYAKSFDNNSPGPMPFYFVLALPFYLIGELGWFSVLGIVLFLITVNKFKKTNESNIVSVVLVTTISLLPLGNMLTK